MMDYDGGSEMTKLAGSIGDVQAAVAAVIPAVVQASTEERLRLARQALAKLRAEDVLTEVEVEHLEKLLVSARANTAPDERLRVAEKVARELQTSDAAPVALAVASVATRNARDLVQVLGDSGNTGGEAADIGDFSTAGECACAGGIVGATAGAVFGPGGVLLGAAAGAAGGAIGFAIAQALKQ
jgi:hypothetical protein